MADGNFNTKLLAPGGFTSGVRTGEARMRQKALKALDAALEEVEAITTEQAEQLRRVFHTQLV